MKHLKGFNESSIVNILNDCRDILIDLSDNHIHYKVWVSSSGSILIEIGDDRGLTSLKSMSTTFDHLISYLESIGYLFSKKSFYEGDNWEYYESCPKCGSDEVTIDHIPTQIGNKFTCDKCKYVGDSEDFTSPEWPLNKSELMWVIGDGVKFDFMRIQFDKVSKKI